MIESPSNLELLLHCYYSPEPHPRFDAPAIQEGIEYLVSNEMIVKMEGSVDRYSTTVKGNVFIKYLMNIPFPIATWEIPNDKMV